MQGHTDRATINERKPITPNMRAFLQRLAERSQERGPTGGYFRRELLQFEKNAARALLDRGMVGWDNGLQAYYINDAGRAALRSI